MAVPGCNDAIAGLLLVATMIAPDPIMLRVSPRIAMAPATLTITVRVIPIASDREVYLTVDGPDYYRASAWLVESELGQPYTYDWVQYRDVPAGDYSVVATIGPVGDVRAWAGVMILVR